MDGGLTTRGEIFTCRVRLGYVGKVPTHVGKGLGGSGFVDLGFCEDGIYEM